MYTFCILRIGVDKNGDIGPDALMEPWQGNYDVDWDKVDGREYRSLSELQLHDTSSTKGTSKECTLVNLIFHIMY